MNRLQLATLLSWAGDRGFQGRKRLQKVAYLLQEAGCPLGCRYTLHHYGPYSRDVADTCDEAVAAGLVQEVGGPFQGEYQYAYKLTPETKTLLEQTPHEHMLPFAPLATELINADLWHLELGSTILYYFKRTGDWDKAVKEACDFKKVGVDLEPSVRALNLAKRVHEQ